MATKLTEEVQIQICAMISVGCSLRTAARLTNCAESTVRNKLRSSRAFAARFLKAEQQCQLICLRQVQLAGQKNWRAAAWLLERANPSEYGPPKPTVMQPHQIDGILAQFADILEKGISDPKDRREVGTRLRELTSHFTELADYDWKRTVKGGR